ncbi:hypothetical protein PIB30_096550, partial [Stylosanthes scabra]|nr:hypothetical protein [Stylosanthes scabra]
SPKGSLPKERHLELHQKRRSSSMPAVIMRFPERVITKGAPSRAAPKEEVVIDASSDNEVNKEVEDATMELIAKPLILEEEDEEEEEEDPEEEEEEEEDPEAEE